VAARDHERDEELPRSRRGSQSRGHHARSVRCGNPEKPAERVGVPPELADRVAGSRSRLSCAVLVGLFVDRTAVPFGAAAPRDNCLAARDLAKCGFLNGLLTVAEYFERWIADKVPPEVRKAQAQDYRRHLRRYVLPALGDVGLARLMARDILGLRAELRQRGLSLKYVKNILAGSLKAMLRDAREIDRVIMHDPFVGVRWPRVEVPGPDPFTAEERQRIQAWFRDRRFSFHAGIAKTGPRVRPHPHYHAFVHLLFWTGMRPSEAAGLQWHDVDLGRGIVRVRRSRHLGEYSATKTRQAERTVQLLPATTHLLGALLPLHAQEDTPVFLNTWSRVLEPRAFLLPWYACLRALSIRQRGLYAMKDTYVSAVLPLKPIPWIEEQTGVAYATLKRHYGKWLPLAGPDAALERLDRLAQGGSLFPVSRSGGTRRQKALENPTSAECRGGESNPYALAGGGF